MGIWVALLRGINVAGRNRLPMADLRAACTDLGWRDVRSYIASGNLVFRSDRSARALTAGLEAMLVDRFSLDVRVTVLPAAALDKAAKTCPFAPDNPRHVHVGFLSHAPDATWDLIERLRTPTEQLVIDDKLIYLFAPEGIGRSKLATHLERALGGPWTLRNLRTVCALADLAAGNAR